MSTDSAADTTEEGIPSPDAWEGLPCEDELLNAASPRSPAVNLKYNCEYVNGKKTELDSILSYLSKISSLVEVLPVSEEDILGVDVGTSSCGIAHIQGNTIKYMGVRMFDSGEKPYTSETKAGDRRKKRAQRLRYRRRAQRRNALRSLLESKGMWPGSALQPSLAKYNLRMRALDELLSPEEFGAVLFHTVKRRGYVQSAAGQSVAEKEAAEEDGDGDPKFAAGPMVAAANQNAVRISEYRTAGEMFARDPEFADRKRNRLGDFRSVLPRGLVEQEVAALFAAQRRLGSDVASAQFQASFEEIAFAQLPWRHSAAGRRCSYLPEERAGVKTAPTIERFAFLVALSQLRLEADGEVRRLTAWELTRAAVRFGRTIHVTFLDLRRWLVLPTNVRFLVRRGEDADIVSSSGAAFGTVTMRGILGRALWQEAEQTDGLTDVLASEVTFARDAADLRERLTGLPLPERAVDRMVDAYDGGELDGFKGHAKLSPLAAAKMIPFLEQGHLIFDAAVKAGFDPLGRDDRILQSVRTPRVVRPILETMKQIHAVITEIGAIPGRIHVEVARDLGLTPNQSKRARDTYRKTAEAHRTATDTLAEILPAAAINDRMVERYMLWQEQGGRCAYTGDAIAVETLLEGALVQVDHVLPLSRSNDHSRNNRVICLARANQEKGNRTPYEWFGSDTEAWQSFTARLDAMPLAARKRKNLLLREFAQREGRVLTRNLNDTTYIARCVMSGLRVLYPKSESYRRVVARPGQLTAVLRRSWGFAKDSQDARSHALDALIVAVADDRMLYELSNGRRSGASAYGIAVPLPWPGFRVAVLAAMSETKISRSEVRRGRAAAHSETIRRVRINSDGSRMLYEKRPLHRLRKGDLQRIPDPDVNGPLIRALTDWFEAGAPADKPPLSPQGHPIRRVRIALTGSTGISRDGVLVRGGIAPYGNVVRVDLFKRGSKYAIVPINAVDIATRREPPRLSPRVGKLRDDWVLLDADYEFQFSIYRNSLLRFSYKDGRVVEGFYRSMEQRFVRLFLADILLPTSKVHAPVTSAVSIEKFYLDRLGRRFPVLRETRTWRGGNAPNLPKAGAAQNNASTMEAKCFWGTDEAASC